MTRQNWETSLSAPLSVYISQRGLLTGVLQGQAGTGQGRTEGIQSGPGRLGGELGERWRGPVTGCICYDSYYTEALAAASRSYTQSVVVGWCGETTSEAALIG